MRSFPHDLRPKPPPRRWPLLLATGGALGLSACVVAPVQRRAPMPPPLAAPAQPALYFYPAQAQPPERQDRDRFECYQWARRQTGQDPGMQPVERPLVVQQAGPPPGAGAAVGAVAGAAIGAATASPRNAGGAMVLGAIIGSLVGAASDNQRVIEQQQADGMRGYRARGTSSRALEDFRRAMSACMNARGYTIG